MIDHPTSTTDLLINLCTAPPNRRQQLKGFTLMVASLLADTTNRTSYVYAHVELSNMFLSQNSQKIELNQGVKHLHLIFSVSISFSPVSIFL